ncbi:MAG: hypothetical protein HY473_01065 [Candidatus Sungbacteria bacterium]|uniref:Ada DNA repair metal-binding domain-containing protein n=1 Tax=Candidatus Sungiibacteriota bacterium TaxID=2750080 RepID=A0A932YWG3_9BACT|nr:hypothetical protein [Candidatus Sungbacteria bacterium]
MLTDFTAKVKAFFKANQKDIFLTAFVFLVSIASFGLGRLSAIWPVKEPIIIEQPNAESRTLKAELSVPLSFDLSPSASGQYVASRNGSAYHLPTCPGAKQIKEENKVWFQTEEEARRAGYKPAGNCPGL